MSHFAELYFFWEVETGLKSHLFHALLFVTPGGMLGGLIHVVFVVTSKTMHAPCMHGMHGA